MARQEASQRMRTSVSILIVVLALLPTVPRAEAQTHAAPPAALDAALQQHVTAAAADRAAVLRALERSDVAAIAGRMGIDMKTAKSAVATADDSQLAQLADHARQLDRPLAGGASTVVISTTTIIIGLLVLILIIVAVN
jgi:hypothetical protein